MPNPPLPSSCHTLPSVLNPFFSKIFGKRDNHVPPAGRDAIRQALVNANVTFSFY